MFYCHSSLVKPELFILFFILFSAFSDIFFPLCSFAPDAVGGELHFSGPPSESVSWYVGLL